MWQKCVLEIMLRVTQGCIRVQEDEWEQHHVLITSDTHANKATKSHCTTRYCASLSATHEVAQPSRPCATLHEHTRWVLHQSWGMMINTYRLEIEEWVFDMDLISIVVNVIQTLATCRVLGSMSSSPASTPSSQSTNGFLKNARHSRIFSIWLIVQELSSLQVYHL